MQVQFLAGASKNKYKGGTIKIYSRKKDYYDSVQSFGQQKEIIYKRKVIVKQTTDDEYKLLLANETIFTLIDTFDGVGHKDTNESIILTHQALIFFCGKIYPFFRYETIDRKDNITSHYCNSLQDVDTFIKKYGSKRVIERWISKKTHSRYSWNLNNRAISIPKIFELSKHFENHQDIYSLHHKFGTPVFAFVETWAKTILVLNPTLKKYKFFKVVDPYMAFQEISMFIAGILGGTSPPMIEVSNDVKIAKHGYDKWSFKKEPWKHV